MTIEENNNEALKDEAVLGEQGATNATARPESSSDTEAEQSTSIVEDADSDTLDADEEEESPSEEGEAEEDESSDEGDDEDAFIVGLADKLRGADAERFDALTTKFAADEKFEKADIEWMSEVSGLSADVVRYGISLQREQYLAQKAADTSIADAEAELGVGLQPLMEFVSSNASDAQKQEWDSAWKVAEKYNDNGLRMTILQEMKAFKDSIPGTKPKTLAHLASSQRAAEAQPVKVEAAPENPPAAQVEDSLMREMSQYSSQALASLAQSSTADPAKVSRARAILKTRGI